MAEEFERRSNKIDEIIGKPDVQEPATDARQKKDERLHKQKITLWMRRRALIYTTVVALVIILAVAIAVSVKNAVKNDDKSDPDVSGVLVIDGEIVSKEEFVFFCSMVIESDTFEQMVLNEKDTAKISENVKTVAVKNAEEFICKVHEAEKAGIVLNEKEITDIENSIELAAQNYKNKDEYCSKFYGMSYEEYFGFRKQIMLVSKCVTHVAGKADISEENQRKVYTENEKYLTDIGVKMIYFDKRGLDENAINAKRLNAETMINYVNEGIDIGKLSQEHSDENKMFDIAEHDNSELLRLNADIKAEFLPVFDKVYTIKVGETMLIETENEICVVHCVEKNDFNSVVNSEKLISYVKYEYASEYFAALSENGKYSATVNRNLYAETDITEFVEIAQKAYVQEAG